MADDWQVDIIRLERDPDDELTEGTEYLDRMTIEAPDAWLAVKRGVGYAVATGTDLSTVDRVTATRVSSLDFYEEGG